jgi:hypothetical protein
MKIFSSKKRVAAIGVVTAATLVGGGMAYAYWTAQGTGTGSAAAGSSAAWTVGESLVPADVAAANLPLLVPDGAIGTGSIQTHKFNVQNSGSGTQSLAKVEISVDPAWAPKDVDGSQPACSAADFSIGGSPAGETKIDTSPALVGSFAAGAPKQATVTVQMINRSTNQDNCKGVTVPLVFSAS